MVKQLKKEKKVEEIKKEPVKKVSFYQAIGRRKESTARVRLLVGGKGEIIVNNKPVEEYFKNIPKVLFLKPFNLTKTEGKYYFTAIINGGGIFGQLGAFIHGISRILSKEQEGKFHKVLKSAGLLTRDSREKERRKPGNAQKARAKKQSPKR